MVREFAALSIPSLAKQVAGRLIPKGLNIDS
jgi:hypothetical protein